MSIPKIKVSNGQHYNITITNYYMTDQVNFGIYKCTQCVCCYSA